MIRSILGKLGLGGLLGRKKTVTTVRLEIIAEQVREFNESKQHLNHKITDLESKTQRLDETVSETLGITRENQDRLNSIEDNLEKIIQISEGLIARSPQLLKEPEAQVEGAEPPLGEDVAHLEEGNNGGPQAEAQADNKESKAEQAVDNI
jgi:exonuclease VII small subunit